MIPYTPEAYQLLHEGSIALAEVEATGMRVDVPYLERAIRRTEHRIALLREDLSSSDVARAWRKHYGPKTNFDSGQQLGVVLFDVLKIPVGDARTPGGSYKTDEASLSTIDHPFIKDYLDIKRWQKAVGTNLRGILEEVVDGYIHCNFNLHLVRTYRSSSSDFNFQNIPVRDPEIAALVRTAFVPRRGRRIIEFDFKGIEVCVSACYNHDPKLIEYLKNPALDMHRDMAMECYMLPQAEVTKAARAAAKGAFVFAEFYGDWYIDCARRLWAWISEQGLTTVSGMPLKAWLQTRGITHLGACDPGTDPTVGSFEGHIRAVEKRFWGQRFRVYDQWRRDWFAQYQRLGYIQTLTGFVCQGYMKKNEAINYGTQGSAFHCLLWVLIQLVSKELKKRKMQTVVVGQIHDSIVADVVPGEQAEYCGLVAGLVERELPRHYPWINVPMKAEAEGTETDAPWVTKYALALGDSMVPGRDDRDTGMVPSHIRAAAQKVRNLNAH